MENAKNVIELLAEQEGINLAMLLSRDGFIVEAEEGRDLTLNLESVGVAVTGLWRIADRVGEEIDTGLGINGILEFKTGFLSTALIPDEDVILAVIADKSVNPATVRHLTVKFSALIAHLI